MGSVGILSSNIINTIAKYPTTVRSAITIAESQGNSRPSQFSSSSSKIITAKDIKTPHESMRESLFFHEPGGLESRRNRKVTTMATAPVGMLK